MRALSIRQPYAELILRGVKTVEYRSFATRKIGERFYIYASLWRPAGPSPSGSQLAGQSLERSRTGSGRASSPRHSTIRLGCGRRGPG